MFWTFLPKSHGWNELLDEQFHSSTVLDDFDFGVFSKTHNPRTTAAYAIEKRMYNNAQHCDDFIDEYFFTNSSMVVVVFQIGQTISSSSESFCHYFRSQLVSNAYNVHDNSS
ncbi:conserved hypothetical protein [Trichinella spiralis]|uniref:hypothetical protein n=1 Tax=Trichinella spiralis TaxID=6334 RepID=UPI0001EFD6D8|nr:conserved hypothetical protein [Trichinella spiralis]